VRKINLQMGNSVQKRIKKFSTPNCGKTNNKQTCLTVLDSDNEDKFKFSMDMKRIHSSESDKTVPVYYKK